MRRRWVDVSYDDGLRAICCVCYWMHGWISPCGYSQCNENAAGGPVFRNCSSRRRHSDRNNWFDVIFRALFMRCTWKVSSLGSWLLQCGTKVTWPRTCRDLVRKFSIISLLTFDLYLLLFFIIIIIIINRQFLTRRNIEHHHPLQGRELSMYREIQWWFDM